MKTVLRMNLFGEVRLTNDMIFLGEEELHSSKMTKLLAYLIIHRNTALPHQRLIEVFWSNHSKAPKGALKNLMYRLRHELSVFGEEEFICTLPGAYRWNPEIEVETDYERFEQLAVELKGMPAREQKKQKVLCLEAIECYQGNVSAVVAEEPWILPKLTRYQSLYMDIVKTLCEIYEKEAEWSELEQLCNEALEIDGFDEDIHCWLLQGLCQQKKYDLAMSHYEKTNKVFYRNMGIRPPAKLRSVFEKMLGKRADSISDLDNMLSEIRETDVEDGVFFCDYQIFRQIYRMEARRLTRIGVAEYIMMLTVRRIGRAWQGAVTDSGMTESVDRLEHILRESLRLGDVVARYSPTQFIVILPACSYEASIAVGERVQKKFQKSIGKRQLEMQFELAELTAVR